MLKVPGVMITLGLIILIAASLVKPKIKNKIIYQHLVIL